MRMLWAFLAFLAAHWIADFVLQTHWQATNKSKRVDALAAHVTSYTVVMMVASAALFGPFGLLFAAANGVLHFATDYVTSRWSAHFFAKQDWHNAFVVIGLDQLVHQATLAATMWLFFGARP